VEQNKEQRAKKKRIVYHGILYEYDMIVKQRIDKYAVSKLVN